MVQLVLLRRKKCCSQLGCNIPQSSFCSGQSRLAVIRYPNVNVRSGIGPKEELERHKIPQLVDLPVGENFSDHPLLVTFWKVRDRNLTIGDMEMISEDVDWTAGVGSDYVSFHRHDDGKTKSLAKKILDTKLLEQFNVPGRPHTETLVM